MFLKSDEDPEAKWMHYMRNGMFEKAWQVSDKVLAQRIGQAQHHLDWSILDRQTSIDTLLSWFRRYYPIHTICANGKSYSQRSNRLGAA
jgi:hypothetical protein